MATQHEAEYYGDGEFEFVKHVGSRELFKNAHWAITQCELWEWLREYKVDIENGFMFSRTYELDRINDKMREQSDVAGEHSGLSYAVTMRNMNYIAKNGYNAFRDDVVKKEK